MKFQTYVSMMSGVVSEEYANYYNLLELKKEFQINGYVNLKGLFKEPLSKIYLEEAERLNQYSDIKDFIMPGYQSPRKLSVIGGQKILNNSPMFSLLYLDNSIKNTIETIVGAKIYHITHKEEFMVVNFLEKIGSTHGWHLDDPKFALVAILKAPKENEGGWVEVIPNWTQFCKKFKFDKKIDVIKAIEYAENNGFVKKITHNAGDVYLLNAGDCMHRVAPITGEVNRIVVNMAFDTRTNVNYGDTANFLYGQAEEGQINNV